MYNYNKDKILKYISKDVEIVLCPDGKIFRTNLNIKEQIQESTSIGNSAYGFIEHTFCFGGNNEAIAKELSGIASRQNNVLPIKEINCYETHVVVIVGEDIYKLIKQNLN